MGFNLDPTFCVYLNIISEIQNSPKINFQSTFYFVVTEFSVTEFSQIRLLDRSNKTARELFFILSDLRLLQLIAVICSCAGRSIAIIFLLSIFYSYLVEVSNNFCFVFFWGGYVRLLYCYHVSAVVPSSLQILVDPGNLQGTLK